MSFFNFFKPVCAVCGSRKELQRTHKISNPLNEFFLCKKCFNQGLQELVREQKIARGLKSER